MSLAEDLALSILEEKLGKCLMRGRDLEATDRAAAAANFDEAAGYADQMAAVAKGPNLLRARQRARELRDRATALRRPAPPRPSPSAPRGGGTAPSSSSGSSSVPNAETTVGGDGGHLTLAETFLAKTDVKWSDIAGIEETKRILKGMVARAVAKPPPGVRLPPPSGILLYGPPGTGKTMLAAAACGSFGMAFFNVPASKLKDKYVGESGKILQAVFDLANTRAPSLIFFDDIDTVVTNRDDGDRSGVSRDLIGGLLTAMDGLGSKGKGPRPPVIVIANTNQPWILDSALRSRFTQLVYVPLPDEPTRRLMLDKMLTENNIVYTGSLDDLAKRTEGFSGRELASLCKTLVGEMIDETNPDLLSRDLTVDQLKEYTMKTAPITQAQVERVLARIRPMTPAAEIQRMEEWARE